MMYATTVHSVRRSREQEYLDGWQRARAELANFRKRAQEQIESQTAAQKQRLLEPVLALADNFRALVAHVPPDLADNAWTQGVTHIARQFEQTLASFNIALITDRHTAFDPRLHEAIEQVKQPGVAPGQVVEVVQPGYIMADRVLRPARVKVSH